MNSSMDHDHDNDNDNENENDHVQHNHHHQQQEQHTKNLKIIQQTKFHSTSARPSRSLITIKTTTLERILHYDHYYSTTVHTWSFGYWDYLVAIPGFLCGSHVFPLVLFVSCVIYGLNIGLFMIVDSILTLLVTTFLKRYTQRHRPLLTKLSLRRIDLRSLLTNYSFPSGDSAQAAVFSCSLFLLNVQQLSPDVSIPLTIWSYLLMMPAVMFARVYYGAHWWMDTVGGICIGMINTMILFYVWDDIIKVMG